MNASHSQQLQDGQQRPLGACAAETLGVERAVHLLIQRHLEDEPVKGYEGLLQLFTRLSAIAAAHVQYLTGTCDSLDYGGSTVTNALTQVESYVSYALDTMRRPTASDALRDAYTALSLCCARYCELLSVAVSVEHEPTAALAQRSLEDYALALMSVGAAFPEAVDRELRASGLTTSIHAVEAGRERLNLAWRSSARGQQTP